jgi:hypothetical protein
MLPRSQSFSNSTSEKYSGNAEQIPCIVNCLGSMKLFPMVDIRCLGLKIAHRHNPGSKRLQESDTTGSKHHTS